MLSAWRKVVAKDGESSLASAAARQVLRGFSLPYCMGAALKNLLYDRGYLVGQRLPARVVSVGNICVGGTGKTPLTLALARYYKDAGIPAAILSRGYGGTLEKGLAVVSDGRTVFLGPEQAGDEPYWLALNSGVPVLVGRSRLRSGMEAVRRFQARVLVLDDAFQHRRLARDVDIVLLPAHRPLHRERVLPAGFLREPLSGLARARVLVLSGYQEDPVCQHNRWWLERRFPGISVFTAAYQPVSLWTARGERPLRELAGTRVAAFCGLARNQGFVETLWRLGAVVAGFHGFEDHHRYSRRDLGRLATLQRQSRAQALVTTEKDAVKLGLLVPEGLELWVLRVRLRILEGEDRFFGLVSHGLV